MTDFSTIKQAVDQTGQAFDAFTKTADNRHAQLLERVEELEAKGTGIRTSLAPTESATPGARWLKNAQGQRALVAVSDDPSASKTIETFSHHKTQQWLVAVNMVSEGVDIPRLRVGVYATNVLTEMYFRQVVGRFVRMQDKVPKPQRASLYLPKDATLVHYAKRIKVERDHVLEEIMPAVQRTLFGTAATSLKEYIPLNGVARLDALINQRTVGHRRLVGHAKVRAFAQLSEQRRTAHRTDLLVGAQQHFVTDALFARQLLKRLQRREHHGNAALHVSNTRSAQHLAFTPRRLEGV